MQKNISGHVVKTRTIVLYLNTVAGNKTEEATPYMTFPD